MKKIIFLIVTFMSFSAEAGMGKLWSVLNGNVQTDAYCITNREREKYGSIYLYIYHRDHPEQITVIPLYQRQTGSMESLEVLGCVINR